MAARRNKRLVTMAEFEDAKDKIMMGAERRSSAMTQAEKELTAYHEAGHAILALNVPSADPLHKATIIPRGRALGMVMQLPEGDRYSMSYKYMISRLAIMMGGRVAEEFKFGKENITSGASSDIEQATKLARAMVTRWGFSDKLGHVAYGDNQEEVFLGHSVARTQNVSEETAQIIDAEVRRLIDEAYSTARTILTKKKKDWIALAEGLLEYETLSGEEIKQLIAGNKPARDMGDDTPPRAARPCPRPARPAARRRARSPKAAWSLSRRTEAAAYQVNEKRRWGNSAAFLYGDAQFRLPSATRQANPAKTLARKYCGSLPSRARPPARWRR
jgi:cell division protease FtsH